jgi:predicted NUDIX family NTP pyrophosphohydrolase
MPEISKSIAKRSALSAGLLMFRRRSADLEVLLVHPGGPFFARKEEGAWSIPKGEAAPGEDLLTRAKTEFEEEIGFAPDGLFLPLGSIRQKGGKTVHAWAVEGELPSDFRLLSNTFELEWPPRSGRRQTFPEIDRAEFFDKATARRKINPAQIELIDRLATMLAID